MVKSRQEKKNRGVFFLFCNFIKQWTCFTLDTGLWVQRVVTPYLIQMIQFRGEIKKIKKDDKPKWINKIIYTMNSSTTPVQKKSWLSQESNLGSSLSARPFRVVQDSTELEAVITISGDGLTSTSHLPRIDRTLPYVIKRSVSICWALKLVLLLPYLHFTTFLLAGLSNVMHSDRQTREHFTTKLLNHHSRLPAY